jgi:hypothetical protein
MDELSVTLETILKFTILMRHLLCRWTTFVNQRLEQCWCTAWTAKILMCPKATEIQFQLGNGEMVELPCSVTHVQNPTLIHTVEFTGDHTRGLSTVKAASFSRVKIPEKVAFLPLEAALIETHGKGALFTPCDFDEL